MNISLKTIAQWTNGTVAPKFENVQITSGLVTDSRIVQPGQLFVPIRGERFDGHSFIPAAVQVCAATLSEEPLDEKIPAVYVKDTLLAYGDIARNWRRSCSAKIVGITGSVGKTTTKEMVAAVLESTFRTVKTYGNHNNNIGLPETVLNIREDTETAVLEMGMNHFGEMAYLTQIAAPDVAVITNIGTMHIEHLGSREGILKAKLEILQGMGKNGLVILNGDEPLLWNLKGTLPLRTLYFGIENPECDYKASAIREMDDSVSFHVNCRESGIEILLPSPGKHNVYNALAAIAVGFVMDILPQKIQKALADYQNTGMRQRIYEKKGFTIIEDCYNAGPESMEAALTILKQHKCSGRRIAVLGDMLELGNISLAEHYKVGRRVAETADMLFAYGTNCERTVTGAITGGMSNNSVFYFTNHEHMARMLRNRARAGDILLFKGSRGMRMEHVLSLFLQEDPV